MAAETAIAALNQLDSKLGRNARTAKSHKDSDNAKSHKDSDNAKSHKNSDNAKSHKNLASAVGNSRRMQEAKENEKHDAEDSLYWILKKVC